MNGIPNIPNFSPSILSSGAVSFGGAALIDAIFGKQWGIVNQYGLPIVLADSVVAMSYDASASVSNLPIESGSFASYNKVDNPSMATVTLAKSEGGPLKRGLFLTQLEALKKSTLGFHVITPEYVYTNYQIVGLSHSRSASEGTTLIRVNVDLQEVKEAKVQYDEEEVQNPSDAQTKDGGDKQAQEAPRDSKLYEIFGR